MSRPGPWILRLSAGLLAAALLGGYWLMATTAWRQKSMTFDEILHLTAGYSYWLTGDYRLHPENGLLPQAWVALPLWLKGAHFPPTVGPDWQQSVAWKVGQDFFHASGNDPQHLLAVGRGAMALLTAGLGLMVFLWSRRLNGTVGGLLSLALFAFCPTMLSHGALATSDAAASFFFLAAVGAIWALLHRLNPGRLLLSCAALGGLALSKMSAPLIVPMAALLVVIRLWHGSPLPTWRGREIRGRPRLLAAFLAAAAVHVLAVGLVIWAAYGFRYSAFAQSDPQAQLSPGGWDAVLEQRGLADSTIRLLRDHRLLPEAYLFGTAHATKFAQRRAAFLNGEYSETGWWTFFPYALLVKTPPPLFVLLAAGAAVAAAYWRSQAASRGAPISQEVDRAVYATAPLWSLLLVYWIAAVNSHLNIGHRHIMPTYAPMFILAGSAAGWLTGPCGSRRRLGWPAASVAAMLLWYAAESLSIRPHYLAYFNQMAGGPSQGYRHLVDSSLDWGQDLPTLKRWLDAHANRSADKVYLAYFGGADAKHYGLDARRLSGWPWYDESFVWAHEELRGGLYCVSATLLSGTYCFPAGPWTDWHERYYQSRSRARRPSSFPASAPSADPDAAEQYREARLARLCAYLRTRQPDAHVGYSILIFRLSDADVRSALNDPIPTEPRNAP